MMVFERCVHNLTAVEVPGCTQRLAEYYRRHAKPHERTAMFVEWV
jgi:hypothetical protein